MISKLTSHHFSAILTATNGQELLSGHELVVILKQLIGRVQLKAVADVAAKFQPQGTSAVVVLEESHVAVHLWPERKLITVDIHVCDYSQDNEVKAMELAQSIGLRFAGDDSISNWSKLTIKK